MRASPHRQSPDLAGKPEQCDGETHAAAFGQVSLSWTMELVSLCLRCGRARIRIVGGEVWGVPGRCGGNSLQGSRREPGGVVANSIHTIQ